MSVERLSDQTTLMRVGDERVPVLSLFITMTQVC